MGNTVGNAGDSAFIGGKQPGKVDITEYRTIGWIDAGDEFLFPDIGPDFALYVFQLVEIVSFR
jgi:hypothetical protein